MNNIFKTLDQQTLNFIEHSCDLCGSKNSKLLRSVFFLGSKFTFVRCLDCGLVYQNPMLDKESLKAIYETEEYWEHKHKSNTNSIMLNYYSYLEDTDIRKRNADIRIKWIKSCLPQGSTVLDLGCSDGLFVHALLGAGYNAKGIDASASLIEFGHKRYGVDIVNSDFEDDWPHTQLFDAITCYATLSNFVNPSRVFSSIHKHLKPGGSLFLNFGDYNRFVSRILKSRLYLYRPTACTLYSRKIIKDYLDKYGFEIKEITNDVQEVPLIRLLGFLRIPGLLDFAKLIGVEEKSCRMILLSGYTLRAQTV